MRYAPGAEPPSIGDGAFSGCESLASVEIPVSVTSIGNGAFKGCNVLESVVFHEGSSLKSISNDAFDGCYSLRAVDASGSLIAYEYFKDHSDIEVTVAIEPSSGFAYTVDDEGVWIVGITKKESFLSIPSSLAGKNVVGIGSSAFEGNTALRQVVFSGVPNVKWVYDSAFKDCTSLTSIDIPSSMISIGNNAFRGCTSLTSVGFADGSAIERIGRYAFCGCSKLPSMVAPASMTSIGDHAFEGCSSLNSVGFTRESALESIDSYVFYGCTSLASVEIPTSVTSIGGSAFEGCVSLASVEIPASVTSIGGSAFEGCASLDTLVFADGSSLAQISSRTFFGCKSLASVEIPAPVTSIYSSAFKGCVSLTSLGFASGSAIEYIGYTAFSGCTSLASLLVPASITSIDDYAFSGCTSLVSIGFAGDSALESIGFSAFSGCTSLTSIEFDDGLSAVSIENYAFKECSSLTSIEIPRVVVSIGREAFSDCSSLASVSFQDGSRLKSVGPSAFSNCTALLAIELPESVKSISGNVFSGCSALQVVMLDSEELDLEDDCFKGLPSDSAIYVVSRVNYEQLTDNSNFLNPNNTNVYLKDGELYALSAANVKVNDATYSGSELCPEVIVTLEGKRLVEGADYELLWTNNVNAGTAMVTVRGIGKYVGFVSQPFDITKANLENARLLLSRSLFTYDGKVHIPTVKTVGGKSLFLGIDYAVSCSTPSPRDAGIYAVTITGVGNYMGKSARAVFTIGKAANTAQLKAKIKVVKASKVKKKKVAVKSFTVVKAKGAVSYFKVAKGSSKKLSVNKKTGKITVKKGTKPGVYKIKVKVKVAGTKNYKAVSKIAIVKIRVKK